MELRELIKDLLSGTSEDMSEKLKKMDISLENLQEMDTLLKAMKKNAMMGYAVDPMAGPGAQALSTPNLAMNEEIIKFDEKGQWKIEKAIKPGPALDYSKFNKPAEEVRAEHDAKAGTIDYSNPHNVTVKKPWSGAADKAAKVRAEAEARAKEPALATMSRQWKTSPKPKI